MSLQAQLFGTVLAWSFEYGEKTVRTSRTSFFLAALISPRASFDKALALRWQLLESSDQQEREAFMSQVAQAGDLPDQFTTQETMEAGIAYDQQLSDITIKQYYCPFLLPPRTIREPFVSSSQERRSIS